MRTLETTDYSHGHCHLFALVAAKTLGTQINVCFDCAAQDDKGRFIPVDCLVHAYIEYDGTRIDAAGFDPDPHAVHNIYPCNEPFYAQYSVEDFEKLTAERGWDNFIDGEYAHITKILPSICAEFNAHCEP